MTLRSWTALAMRESRGSAGRLAFFAACLSVGVAAVVAVAGLSDALDSGIRSRARQLLAADIALESRRPIPSEVVDAVDALSGARRAEVRELPSMVSVPDGSEDSARASLLCEIKAVEGYDPDGVSPAFIRAHAEQYDVQLFKERLLTLVEEKLASQAAGPGGGYSREEGLCFPGSPGGAAK